LADGCSAAKPDQARTPLRVTSHLFGVRVFDGARKCEIAGAEVATFAYPARFESVKKLRDQEQQPFPSVVFGVAATFFQHLQHTVTSADEHLPCRKFDALESAS
jgi:hypothetical protein